jgi:hypothetical protein
MYGAILFIVLVSLVFFHALRRLEAWIRPV